MSKTAIIGRVRLGILATAVWLGATMAGVPSVGAQSRFDLDHLECAKVTKDSNPTEQQIIDLETRFGLEPGCKLDTTAVAICTPTIKFHFEELGDSGDDPRGERLFNDMLCYEVNCDKREKQAITLEDQFGRHEIEFKDAKLLCTPIGGK